jgi:outer membrane receptor for ferrienterochelin and colicin
MRKFYLTLIVVLTTVSSYAQEQINVTVADLKFFKPVSNTEVYIENQAIGYLDSAKTNNQGQVSFIGLQLNGQYKVFTKEDNIRFASSSDAIELRSNFTRTITLSLQSKSESELHQVVIKSKSTTLLNTQSDEVSSEMNIKEIQELPIEGRDMTQLLYRFPNVSLATGFFSEAPNVSINGSNGLYNSYLIDGMDNNERFLGGQMFPTPIGFIQNLTVLTNNYSVEYGNTANGLVNVTPRSGSDTVHGEVYFLTRPGAGIDGKTQYPERDLSGNAVKQGGFQRFQEGFGIGGPLVKDKTFFYINYEHTNDIKDVSLQSTELNVNNTVRNTNRWDLISAKIDQKWNEHWKSSFRANIGLVGVGFQGGGISGGITFPSAGYIQDRNSLLIASKNTYTKGDFTSETNVEYSRFHWNYARALNTNSPDVTVNDTSGQAIAYLGNPGYIFNSYQNAVQVQQRFIVKKRNQTLKFGLEFIGSQQQLYGGGDPNGSYIVQLNASQLSQVQNLNKGTALTAYDIPRDASVLAYNVELRQAQFGVSQNIYTAYAEDQWAITNKLTGTIGLRYDYDNLSKGGASSGDYNNIAPRISLNYKLNNRSVVRAGFGIFYDKILYTLYSDALQQNSTNSDYIAELQAMKSNGILPANTNIGNVTYNGNQVVSPPDPKGYLNGPTTLPYDSYSNNFSGERRILNPNGYQNPNSQQFSVGYQYQINRKMLFYVDAVYNHTYNLPRLYYLNAPSYWDAAAHPGVARSTASADSTRPIPIYTDPTSGEQFAVINGHRLSGVAKDVVYTDMGGESKYYGLSVNFLKQKGDDFYSFRLTYTLSSLRNNTEDVNFRALNGNDYSAEWGQSINDRTHIINALLYFYPVKNLTLTLASLIQSGQPINRVPNAANFVVVNNAGMPVLDAMGSKQYSNDLNGTGNTYGDGYVGNANRYPGVGRNADRLPWNYTFDVSLQYGIPIKGNRSKLILSADVFNVFNRTNLSGYANNATQSNQIQLGPTGGPIVVKNAAPPREYQFGVRYAF